MLYYLSIYFSLGRGKLLKSQFSVKACLCFDWEWTKVEFASCKLIKHSEESQRVDRFSGWYFPIIIPYQFISQCLYCLCAHSGMYHLHTHTHTHTHAHKHAYTKRVCQIKSLYLKANEILKILHDSSCFNGLVEVFWGFGFFFLLAVAMALGEIHQPQTIRHRSNSLGVVHRKEEQCPLTKVGVMPKRLKKGVGFAVL